MVNRLKVCVFRWWFVYFIGPWCVFGELCLFLCVDISDVWLWGQLCTGQCRSSNPPAAPLLSFLCLHCCCDDEDDGDDDAWLSWYFLCWRAWLVAPPRPPSPRLPSSSPFQYLRACGFFRTRSSLISSLQHPADFDAFSLYSIATVLHICLPACLSVCLKKSVGRPEYLSVQLSEFCHCVSVRACLFA